MVEMPDYTTYIPKEFFLDQLNVINLIILFVVILAIILFFAYKFHRILKIKGRPESF